MTGYRATLHLAALAIALTTLLTPLAARSQSISYTYDALGRLTKVHYAGDPTVVYVYDAAGNRTRVSVGASTVPHNPTNQPPVAVNDSTTLFPYSTTNLALLNNDSDPDAHPISIASITTPTRGTATIGPAGAYVTFYAPAYGAASTFQYTISDGNGGTATASVTINFYDPPPEDPCAEYPGGVCP